MATRSLLPRRLRATQRIGVQPRRSGDRENVLIASGCQNRHGSLDVKRRRLERLVGRLLAKRLYTRRYITYFGILVGAIVGNTTSGCDAR